MSTSFILKTDTKEEHCIAVRFFGGNSDGYKVRFAFLEVLLVHLREAELVGDDGSSETVGTLLEKAEIVEFLAHDVSSTMHLAHGSFGTGEIKEEK